MHERSLISALLRQVTELVAEEDGARVTEVRVRVGPLSGVEPLLLASAFDDLAPAELGRAARLVMHEVDLQGRCQRCGHDFVMPDFRFVCPLCDATAVRVTGGDGVVLESIALAGSSAQGASA